MVFGRFSPTIQIVQTKGSETYPMPAYVKSWQDFRSVSNEAETIAFHITHQKWRPDNTPIKILDVGTGDGILLKQLVSACPWQIAELVCVDPNSAFLQESERNF